MIDVIVFLGSQGLALRGHDEIIGSFHNGNFLGLISLLTKYVLFLANHIHKYENKGQGSTSYFSHSICNELIKIMANNEIKTIVKEVQESRYFSITGDSTLDITHTDQLCITLRYVLPTGPVETFMTFVPIKSHTRLRRVEIILAKEFNGRQAVPRSILRQC